MSEASLLSFFLRQLEVGPEEASMLAEIDSPTTCVPASFSTSMIRVYHSKDICARPIKSMRSEQLLWGGKYLLSSFKPGRLTQRRTRPFFISICGGKKTEIRSVPSFSSRDLHVPQHVFSPLRIPSTQGDDLRRGKRNKQSTHVQTQVTMLKYLLPAWLPQAKEVRGQTRGKLA